MSWRRTFSLAARDQIGVDTSRGRRICDRLQPAEDEDEDVGDDAKDQHDAGIRNAPVKDCVAPTM